MNKLKYDLIRKIYDDTSLTSDELNMLLFLAKNADDFGTVSGMYYKEVSKELSICHSQFYNIINSLQEKGYIKKSKEYSTDINITMEENMFIVPDDRGNPVTEYRDYLNMNMSIFSDSEFYSLKACAKKLLLAIIVKTINDRARRKKNGGKTYAKIFHVPIKMFKVYADKLHVTIRMIKSYFKDISKWISIYNDNEYIEFANYIEKKIIEDKYSPEAALYAAKAENFETSICTTTLYSYIEKGVFLNLTNEGLPSKKKKKRKYKKVKVQKKAAAGTSIEKRPKEIDNRDEITDYEMDTVMGGQGISKKSFLVLTERRTRLELLFLLKSHTAKEVVRTLNYIEKLLGTDNFRKLFRSITVDNGTEFSDAEGMAKTRRSNKKRTDIYYCHPYRSSERGTNENNNKLVRRHHPKGTVFDDLSRSEVRQLQDWMNTYPRRIFKGETSAKRFKEELDKMDFGDKKDIVYRFFLPRAAPEDI